MKIPIKKYVMDESLSWEERYRQLEAHHKEETGWMIKEIKEVEAELNRIRKLASRWGPSVKYNP